MNKILIYVSLSISLLLTSCASIFNGSTQQLSIRSNVNDAKLYVNEEYVGKNSSVTTLQKKKKYEITAKKEGCTDVTVPVTKSFDPTTLLGILIDYGVISILVIDGAATGAWQKFDRTSYVIDPQC